MDESNLSTPVPQPESVDVPPAPVVPKTQNNSVLIMLSVLLIILVGVVAFLAYQNWTLQKQITALKTISSPSPTPVATTDLTATWKTYTYKDLTFNYPNDWVLGTDQITAVRPPDVKSGSFPAVTFFAIDNPKGLSIKDYYIEAGKNGMAPNIYSATAASKTISGVTGYYQENQNCEPLECDIFAFPYNNKIYEVNVVYSEMDTKKLSDQETVLRPVFNQILSTFKFIGTQSSSFTSDQAVQAVNSLPEVKTYFASTQNAKIAVDQTQTNNTYWSVQVYESFPDHNATFHWYNVDKTTGAVNKQI